jgi:uncharacterized membrane protein YhdT
MKLKIDMNWQGFLTIVFLSGWTVSRVYEKFSHPETGWKGWFLAIAPLTIFVTMCVLIYLLSRLSTYVYHRSRGKLTNDNRKATNG